MELIHNGLQRWSNELSTPEKTVEPYLVEIDFSDIADPGRRQYFNQIPTSFTLTGEQADDLIAAGRELLVGNPEFQRFIADLQ